MILEDAPRVYVHNPKKIKRNRLVQWFQSQRQRSRRLSLRSAGLRTTSTPFHMDMNNLFTYLLIGNKYKYRRCTHSTPFNSMTLKLQHPFTLIFAGQVLAANLIPNYIVRVQGANFVTLCLKILCCVIVKTTPLIT